MSRVLLVDDDENLLRIAKKLLTRAEPTLKTVTALSAREALQKLADDSIDVVVTDYRMPGMDGLKFLKILREEGNDIPFIMFTGQGREEVAMEALNLGADYYLMKGGDTKSLYGELAHIIRQVMQHKRTERALRESEARYRELVEKLHEGVLVEDAEEVITFVNPRTAEMLGYAEEDLVGRHWTTIIPNTEVDKIRSETAKRPRGISSTYEGTLLAQDGRAVPVIISATPLFSASGAFQGVLTVFTDITERKQAEDTLRESEQRYKIIKQMTTEGFWRVDLQGRILDVNGTLCQMLGWTRDELLELSVADIEAAENPEEVAQHIAKIMEQGYDRFETRHRCKDGTLLDIEVNVSYLAGEAAEFIAFLRDITERRKSEIQLKQQRKELREFAYAMAHDLKSHLLSIEGYAEVLKTEHDMTCAKKIGQLATHMNVLLRRSLLLADAGQIIEKTEEVALTGLVQEIAEVAVPERVRFELENLPTVRGDPEKLSQVFQNLLENAVEHGQPRTIEVRRRETADGTELLVMNDGKAIPPDQRAALFDREFTTKEGGRGLGVAIIRKVIEAHGWQIHLDETPETTFRIFIPTSRKL